MEDCICLGYDYTLAEQFQVLENRSKLKGLFLSNNLLARTALRKLWQFLEYPEKLTEILSKTVMLYKKEVQPSLKFTGQRFHHFLEQ